MPNYPEGATDVTSQAEVTELSHKLGEANELSIDLEADSLHAFHARLCFVQIGTDSDVFLVDPLVPGLSLSPLAPLFQDPRRTKFFHAAQGDLQFLAEVGLRVQGLFDTHRAATLLGWPKVGLADLVREKFGITLAKEHQQADFAMRPLPAELRKYIAEDVRYLNQIGRWVQDACREADIYEEVELDCQRMSDEAQVRPDIANASPKIPRAGSPKDQALALALSKALHRLRLEWAEKEDVPMGKMLSNAAITAIATRPPRALRELAKAQGVRGQVVREHGEEILKLISDLGAQADKGELPSADAGQAARDPKKRKREELLKQFRADQAAARKVTPSVILSNPLVEALSTEPPVSLEALRTVPYFGEKRVRLYGEALLALLKPEMAQRQMDFK